MQKLFSQQIDQLFRNPFHFINRPKKQQNLTYLGNKYTIGRLLGAGSYGEVREATELKSRKRCAIKFISERGLASLGDELLAMEIKHKNVLSLNQTGSDYLKDANGNQEMKHYIEMDLADGGELFDWIAHGGRFEEGLARYYFSEAISGIKAMHDKNLAHRDLKPENFLLDKAMVLKIADFGLAGLLTGRDGSGLMKSYKGTEGYKAPEIVDKKGKYDGRAADVFSMGVILFIMLTRSPPFGSDASKSNRVYQLIQKDPQQYWEIRKAKTQHLSKEAKDLLLGMLQEDPSKRLTVNEIQGCPWMQKDPILKHSEAQKMLSSRYEKVMKQVKADRQEKDKQIQDRKAKRARQTNYRGDFDDAVPDSLDDHRVSGSYFFTSCPPAILLDELQNYLNKQSIVSEPTKGKCELKYSLPPLGIEGFDDEDSAEEGSSNDEDEEESWGVCVRVLKQNEKNFCIEFINLSSPKIDFLDHFTDVRDGVLDFANNSEFVESEEENDFKEEEKLNQE